MKNVDIYEKLAPKYDQATTIVSFGIEEAWREMFVKEIKKHIDNGVLLDVASATGKMASKMDFDKMYLLEPSRQMNQIAKKRLEGKNVIFIEDFAEEAQIPEQVDIITSFMGVRNFDDMDKGIRNLDKYLKDGGYFAIVELTKSDSVMFGLSMFYISKIVPLLGGLITGEYESYKKFNQTIKHVTDEDILQNYPNYHIITHKRLFPPIASMMILKKDEC
ncbi:MAG: class I SAM-dependent methyltransferase [Epsilonproteobacteria bacterium]|nr:class I SAM-dependent methyltransferase [Campylobacterota bacterium]